MKFNYDLKTNVKYIFNKNSIVTFVFTLIIFILSFFAIMHIETYVISNNIKEEKLDFIRKLNTNELTNSLVCKTVNCDYYLDINNNKYYDSNDNEISADVVKEILSGTTILGIDKYTGYSKENAMFFDNNIKYSRLNNIDLSLIVYFILIPCLIVFLIYSYFSNKKKIVENLTYKYETENKLQQMLSESLYHELNGPIAIVEAIVSSGYGNLIELLKDKKDIERIKRNKIVVDNNLNRMKNTLEHLSYKKNIRRSKCKKTLDILLNTVNDGFKLLTVRPVEFNYNNEMLFHKTYLPITVDGSEVMNIVNIIINNAIEAHANKINYDLSICDDYVKLLITDNGSGVKLPDGSVGINNRIFKYGYTSKKDGSGGVGLAVAKDYMIRNKGDIYIESTSDEGSTFVIKIKK